MSIKVSGIVLNSKAFSDNDLILTLLTDELGKIDAIAKSVRKTKKAPIYTQPFAYSDFVLYKGKNLYTINSADNKNAFYELREDLKTLALAQYFLETNLFIPKDVLISEGPLLLKLLLNSLYLLCKRQVNETVIKIVYEIKYAILAGFLPEISSCVLCRAKDPCIWSYDEGFYCEDCGTLKLENSGNNSIDIIETKMRGVKLSTAMILTLRHIINNEGITAYSFKINEQSLAYLSSITERYLAHHLDTQFKSLEYYNNVCEIEESIRRLKKTEEKHD